jgi:hypothetical protein
LAGAVVNGHLEVALVAMKRWTLIFGRRSPDAHPERRHGRLQLRGPFAQVCETGCLYNVNVLVGPDNLVPTTHPPAAGAGPMAQLGANALGEVLEPGRVPDCYLGLRLDPDDDDHVAGVLVVAPAALLHPGVPQPDGTVLYELVTGHPARQPGELVFLADLTVELRAWPADTWSKVRIDPQVVARGVVAGWQRGDLPGLRLGGLTTEEALALERPAMTYVRAQLGDRLQGQLARAYRRWRHPSSGRRAGDRFL